MIAAVRLAQLVIAYQDACAVFFPAMAKDMGELATAVMLNAGVDYWLSPGGASITCTTCRKTSHNPNDVTNRYCGNCHEFHQGRSLQEWIAESGSNVN